MVTKINGININAHSADDEAHQLTLGDGVTIAIIDDGVDIDHLEFSSPGKIIAPRDETDHADTAALLVPVNLAGSFVELTGSSTKPSITVVHRRQVLTLTNAEGIPAHMQE